MNLMLFAHVFIFKKPLNIHEICQRWKFKIQVAGHKNPKGQTFAICAVTIVISRL